MGPSGQETFGVFTGLVQAVGRVIAVERGPGGSRLRVDTRSWAHRPEAGDSISVSGVCLTVAGVDENGIVFDLVPETLARTTLGLLGPGGRVNLEHAATPGTLLGGHLVQGHVDGVGVVDACQNGAEHRLRVRLPEPGASAPPAERVWQEAITPKGSVTVDGVSLTVAAAGGREGWFEVALIPTTLARTTLGDLRVGDRVNIEADAMAKTVVHWLREWRPR
jgi:riboflavin synthase